MKKLLDLAQHSWIQSESLTDLQLVVFMLIKLICPTSSTIQLIKHKAFIYYINIVKKNVLIMLNLTLKCLKRQDYVLFRLTHSHPCVILSLCLRD